MKKLAILLSLFVTASLFAAQFFTEQMTPGVTVITATSTNSTAGTAIAFGGGSPDAVEIFVSATGSLAATNGVLALDFAKSYNGTNYNSVDQTAITVTLTMAAGATNSAAITTQNSDYLYLNGSYLKHVRTRNTTQGNFSNITVWVQGRKQE